MNKTIEILPESYIPTSQEALADPVLLRNVSMLFDEKSEPSIASILQLFSLAEAIVLFDRVIANVEWRVSQGFEKANLSFLDPVSDALALKKDLMSFSIYYGIPNDEAFDYAMNYCGMLDKRFFSYWRQVGALPYASGNDFALEISDTLNVFNRVWKWKCNWVANPLWEVFFVLETPTSELHPKDLYKQLSTVVQKQIEKLQGMKFPALMFIPPVPALALYNCNGDLSRFWSNIAEIRKEFSSCRQKYARYQSVVANPEGRSLGELIQIRRDAIADVENELNKLAMKRTDGRIVMELWDTVAKLDVAGKEGEIAFSTGANLKSLLSLALKEIKAWIVRGRAHSLFDIYKKTLSIRGYEKLLQTNFHTKDEALSQEVTALEKFSQEVKKALQNDLQGNWKEN